MTKHIKLISSIITCLLMMNIAPSVGASENTSNNDIVVDENTPDAVLLKGKELENFAAVKKPSERLRVDMDNVDPTVEVLPVGPKKVMLKVMDANNTEVNQITSTYRKISNASEIEIIRQKETKKVDKQ